MKKSEKTLNIMLCGPSDVSKELAIAKEVIDEWNRENWESTGCGLRSKHWSSDSAPDLSRRGQDVINHQILDESDIVVAVFWERLGTPTGLAESGTVEEITRGFHRGTRTMVYFSNLERFVPRDSQESERVKEFRNRVFGLGLGNSFTSRNEFKKKFRDHLKLAVQESLERGKQASTEKPEVTGRISQTGKGNVQIVGDGNTIQTAPTSSPKVVILPHPSQVSASEQKQILDWLDDLATLSNNFEGKDIGSASTEWRSRFKNKFKIPRYNALESSCMGDARRWYLQQRGILYSKPKARKLGASDAQMKKKIKTLMSKMGRTNDEYYPKISARLKMPVFTSLTQLSSKDLKRVCGVVGRDSER